MASIISTTMASTLPAYQPPDIASWPPFYTLQPNQTTRSSQLSSWSDYIQSYCAAHRIFRLTASHAIFSNTRINRRLQPADARHIFAYMITTQRAEAVDAAAAAGGKSRLLGSSTVAVPTTEEIWVYWRKAEEWAADLASWVEETGQRGTVLTLYELLEGEQTEKQMFHGLPLEMAKRAVGVLVRRGKAVVFGDGGSEGVKIF